MVDKSIGTAYPNVKLVADNIEVVKYVAYNMAAIAALAQSVPFTHRLLTSTAGILGSTVQIPLPNDLGVDQLAMSQIMLVTPGGDVFMEGSDVFKASISGGTLRFNLLSGAPTNAQNAQIRWLLTYAPILET